MADLSEGSGRRSGLAQRWRGIALAVVVALLGLTAAAQANFAIPGDLTLQGLNRSTNEGLWLLCAMTMCIGVEGAVYAYAGFIRRPFFVSAIANAVSLVAGFMLGWVVALPSILFPESDAADFVFLILMPTLASIGIEGLVVIQYADPGVPHHERRAWGVVVVANLVTNAILVAYLYIAAAKAG
jgi:hypothetical protein